MKIFPQWVYAMDRTVSRDGTRVNNIHDQTSKDTDDELEKDGFA